MANRELTPYGGGRLSRWEDPFGSFRREFDRLFDNFLSPMSPAEPRSFAADGGFSNPAIDVKETDKAYEVSAELPGIEQKDVQLDLRDNVLTISGEKREERSEDKGGRHWSERSYGRFQRAIPLPQEIDADKAEATCKNGVLKITLPKNPRAAEKSHRIEIRG
ncbi:MAG TPA: Hsp20/alpha crystallin family protein [Caulobacteraceae bacterium]|nr:Hsp20/alpha crystallin family protein [Caulobacteraceae bacterium]